MLSNSIISTDRQAREIAAAIEQISHALSSEQTLKSIVDGLPREVTDGVRRSLISEKRELAAMLNAYQEAKVGNFQPTVQRAGGDLGDVPIVARLMKGWTQRILRQNGWDSERGYPIFLRGRSVPQH